MHRQRARASCLAEMLVSTTLDAVILSLPEHNKLVCVSETATTMVARKLVACCKNSLSLCSGS